MTSKIAEFIKRSDHPDGPFMTIAEVAEYFERSKDTIRRWCQRLAAEGVQVPSHKMELNEHGTSFVWCYTKSDIETLETLSEGINPKGGRPPKKEKDDAH